MKSKVSFVCQECGYDSPEWLGKCPECGNWNSLKEFRQGPVSKSSISSSSRAQSLKPQKLHEITYSEKNRQITGFAEVDSVLGGGLVAGAVMLLAGDPGIGKSTLLLQIALTLSQSGKKVLYISGEESSEQIKLRAERIQDKKAKNENFLLISLNNTDSAVQLIEDEKPALVIVDSIQTMESEAAGGLAGAIGQIRYAAQQFIRTAKQNQIPVFLVGHVTKEGMVAGPMLLSHMVDTVLFFEGEKSTNIRILRSLKNRFGPVDEVGVLTMEGNGISEVKNPEHIFLDEERKNAPGSVLTSIMEGSRTFMVEIQALTVFSKLPMPRRVVSGIDGKRVELLLAVLQKHCNVPLAQMDVFVNVAGGLRISDRAVDLAVCLALFSSFKNIILTKTVAIAEVGLLGELRKISGIEKRVKEAHKLGFKHVVTQKEYKNLVDVIKSL